MSNMSHPQQILHARAANENPEGSSSCAVYIVCVYSPKTISASGEYARKSVCNCSAFHPIYLCICLLLMGDSPNALRTSLEDWVMGILKIVWRLQKHRYYIHSSKGESHTYVKTKQQRALSKK